MKYLSKFNELNTVDKVLSSDKIEEINKDLTSIADDLDEKMAKINKITEDISDYTSESQKGNTQIDDAYVDLKTLFNKLKESLDLINSVNYKLKDYSEKGTQYLS